MASRVSGRALSLKRLVGHVPEPAPYAVARTRTVDIELSEPLATLAPDGWEKALVLVRLHGQPLGTVEVGLDAGPVPPDALARIVRRELGEKERAHLRRDGLEEAGRHPGQGRAGEKPRCLRDLEPPSPVPLVSVVVATRDRSEQLAACLRSLLRSDYPAFEVIVVDNAPSDDATQRTVESLFGHDSRVRYVKEERPGASVARNVGAEIGRGDFVAFTDDDAVVDRLWLAALVAGFGHDSRVACVTGLTLPIALETPAQQAFELYGGMGLGYEARAYDLEENRGDTLLYPYTAGVFGASNNAAFRRRQFLERGGFDESLGPATPAFGAEDLDVFLSTILDGHRITYEPRALVWHEHRRDFPDLYWQVFTYSAGLTALLTKWALTSRAVAADLAGRVPRLLPAALLRAHRSGSEAGCGDYPAHLRWLERAGYLYGPVAYARSRARARSEARRRPARADLARRDRARL